MSIADKLLTIAENQKKVYDAGVFDAGYAKGYDEGFEKGLEKGLENPSYPMIMDGRKKLQYFYQDLRDWESFVYNEEYGDYVSIELEPIDPVPFPKGTQNIIDFSHFASCWYTSPYGNVSEETLPTRGFLGTLDTSGAENMWAAFAGCTYVEELNFTSTSKVKNFQNTFMNMFLLKHISGLDLSSATNVTGMFYYCKELENVSLKNISPLASYRNMFTGCQKMTNFPTLDFLKTTDYYGLFSSCSSMVTAPENIGIGNLANMNMTALFGSCSNLKTIPCITTNATTSFSSTFNGCSALENITFDGVIGKTGISFSGCPLLTHDSLMSIINALETKTSGTFKITLGSTNLAKLTDEEKLIITNKGWQVS